MSLPPSYWADQIRADLEARRANLCRHGATTCRDCADHRPDPKPEVDEETADV